MSTPRPDHRGDMALTAIRAGASDEDAAAYAEVPLATFTRWLTGPWGKEVRKARADLAVYASGVLRKAVGSDTGLAQRVVDRQTARHELDRLRALCRDDG